MNRRYTVVAVLIAMAVVAAAVNVLLRGAPAASTIRPPAALQQDVPGPIEHPDEEPEAVIEPEPSVVADSADTSDENACRARFGTLSRYSPSDYRQAAREAADLLGASGNPEFELAAAMANRRWDADGALELIRGSGGERTRNPLALWVLIDICQDGRASDCDFPAIERSVRTQHAANGAFWLAIAGKMTDDGRDEDAARAIRQAIAAPTYDSYLIEQITLMERALAASTDWAYAERVFNSLEYAFESPPGMRRILQKCEVELSGEWGMLCDELAGRLLENDSDMLTHGLGIELRTKILKAKGERVELGDFASDMIKIAEVLEDEERILEIFNVLMSDEILLRTFIENMQSGGEVEAFNSLANDIERLKSTAGYDQCNFVTNPYLDPLGL